MKQSLFILLVLIAVGATSCMKCWCGPAPGPDGAVKFQVLKQTGARPDR